jgi:MFS family permease
MVCGANSDLFGRRYFILFGNILVFVGCVVGGTSHSIGQSIAAHVLIGFGAGNCQLAAFALPELLPNKWRHFAVVIADGLIYFGTYLQREKAVQTMELQCVVAHVLGQSFAPHHSLPQTNPG